MRAVLGGALPALAARINRAAGSAPLKPAFDMPLALPAPSAAERAADAAPAVSEEERRAWDWDGAKARLADAYAEGGVGRWAEVVVHEVEVEAAQLRARDAEAGQQ
jgi:hypothetical protein